MSITNLKQINFLPIWCTHHSSSKRKPSRLCNGNAENIEAVKKMNRRISSREVADNVCIPFSSCQANLTDVFGMNRAAAKIVLKIAKF